MNERIKQLAEQAGMTDDKFGMFFAKDKHDEDGVDLEKFAELIVEECRTVVTEVYRNTPLELCGPLLTADEEIAKHFYGVGGMSTEDKKTLIKELLGVKNDYTN